MRPDDFERMSEKDRYIYLTMYEYPEQVFREHFAEDPLLVIGVMAGIYNIGLRPQYQAGAQ